MMLKKAIVSLLAIVLCVAFYVPSTHAKLADGIYSIPYQVNAYGKDNPSVGNDYFVKPAKLTVKDGKMVAEMTVKNAAWVVKVEAPGYKLISEDKAADTRLFQIDVPSLSEDVVVAMRIEIPSLSYYHSYNVDFVFDESKATKTGDVQAEKEAAATTTTKPTTSATAAVAQQQQQAQATTQAQTTASTQTAQAAAQTTTATATTTVKNPQTSDELPYIALLLFIGSAFFIMRLRKQTA